MRGITVILYDKVETGKDPFGAPTYEVTPVEVENVLVAPMGSADAVSAQNLTGRKVTYQLAIPKGDTHVWLDRDVEFLGKQWHTYGFPTKGIDELVPTAWNEKVMVEMYG